MLRHGCRVTSLKFGRELNFAQRSHLGIDFMNFTKSIGPVDVKTEPNKLNPIDSVKICEDFDKRKYFGKFQCFAKFPECNSTTVLALQKKITVSNFDKFVCGLIS